MSVNLFSSRGMQQDKCVICLGDEPEDLETNGPIVNHLVGKHAGFHTECLGGWMRSSEDCPACRVALNPDSLVLKEKEIKPLMFREIIEEIGGEFLRGASGVIKPILVGLLKVVLSVGTLMTANYLLFRYFDYYDNQISSRSVVTNDRTSVLLERLTLVGQVGLFAIFFNSVLNCVLMSAIRG